MQGKHFCTMFGLQNQNHMDLHCTHKYFGELEPHLVMRVIDLLDGWFAKRPYRTIQIPFDQEDWFGPGQVIRVLRCDPRFNQQLLPDLKHVLDRFHEDTYGKYKPHITTDRLNRINIPFDRYLFVVDGKIIRTYHDDR